MPAAHAPRRVLVGLKALFDHSEGGEERVDPGVAELRPAVGVEHLDPGERELDVGEGGLHERRVLSTAAGAAHDLPVVQVDEQADVAPAGPGAHVGEVGRHVGAREVAVEAPAEHVGGVGRGGGARRPGRPLCIVKPDFRF